MSTNVTSFRNPPTLFSDTLYVGGGGSPRTPAMRTRSAATCSSRIESNRAVTSGPRYLGPPISYSSCDVTVPIDTSPPVPSCLPITDEPSCATSAHGKPSRSMPGTSVKNE